jgi:hypothetical protein
MQTSKRFRAGVVGCTFSRAELKPIIQLAPDMCSEDCLVPCLTAMCRCRQTLIGTRSAALGQESRESESGISALAGAYNGASFSLLACPLVSVQVCRISAATGDTAELMPFIQKVL